MTLYLGVLQAAHAEEHHANIAVAGQIDHSNVESGGAQVSGYDRKLAPTQVAQPRNGDHQDSKGGQGRVEIKKDYLARVLSSPGDTFNGVIAFCTLILAAVGLWQASIARSAARRQLRAYVTIMSGSVRFEGGRITARLTVKNAGQTPAFNLDQRGALRVTDDPSSIMFDDDEHTPQSAIIGPQQESHFNAAWDSVKYPAVGEQPEMHLVVEITYRDAFKRQRKTTGHFTVQGDPVHTKAGALRKWQRSRLISELETSQLPVLTAVTAGLVPLAT